MFKLASSDVSRLIGEQGECVTAINIQEQPMPIDPDLQKALDDINKRIADQTQGLRRVTEGKYGGAGGSAAIVVALEGGNTTINPQPDYVPKP